MNDVDPGAMLIDALSAAERHGIDIGAAEEKIASLTSATAGRLDYEAIMFWYSRIAELLTMRAEAFSAAAAITAGLYVPNDVTV